LVQNNDITSFQFKINPSSTNLIINGEFNSDSDWDYTGAELVINGNFTSGSGWTANGGWVIAAGMACDSPGGILDTLVRPGILIDGKLYRVVFTVLNYVAGSISALLGNISPTVGTSRSANGIYTEDLVCNGGTDFALGSGSTFNGCVDNVSVKQIGWSIAGGRASHTPGNVISIKQSVLTSGKYYKVTYTVSGRTAGSLNINAGSFGDVVAYNSSFTSFIEASDSNIYFTPSIDFDGSIDNVTIHEIVSNFEYFIQDSKGNLSEINSLTQTIVNNNVLVEFPWDYQDLHPGCYTICVRDLGDESDLVVNGDFSSDSNWDGAQLGSELIINGAFNTDTDWFYDSSWSISGGMANINMAIGIDVLEPIVPVIPAGGYYKVSIQLLNHLDGNLTIHFGTNPILTNINSNGVYTAVGLANGSNIHIYGLGVGFSVDNVSLKSVNWDISGGMATHYPGNTIELKQLGILTIGITYRVIVVVSGMGAGTLTPKCGTSAGDIITMDGGYQMEILSNGVDLVFSPSSDFNGSIDDVQVYVTSDDMMYCSDCFQLAETHSCSQLLSWYNQEDNFGFVYSTGFVFKMRVASRLWKSRHAKEKKVFKYSDSSRKVLFSDSDKIIELIVEEMPEYMHDALSTGIDHDFFIVGEDHYTAVEEDYEPVWRNSSLLAPVTIELIKNFQQSLRNNNC
jgi:hypothetical protein